MGITWIGSGRFTAGFATITDDFNRANSTTTLGTATTGQSWVALAGTWGIETNKGYRVSTVDSDQAAILTGQTDATITATITWSSFTAGEVSVLARGADASNHYLALLSTSTVDLYKRVAGTYTLLGTSGAVTWATGDTIGLRVSGTSIKGYRNGAEVVSTTDSSLTSGTYAGFRAGGTTNTMRYDDLSITSP